MCANKVQLLSSVLITCEHRVFFFFDIETKRKRRSGVKWFYLTRKGQVLENNSRGMSGAKESTMSKFTACQLEHHEKFSAREDGDAETGWRSYFGKIVELFICKSLELK